MAQFKIGEAEICSGTYENHNPCKPQIKYEAAR